MKVSELWLRKFVNLKNTSKELIEQINRLGLEVNNVTPLTIEKTFKGKNIIGKIVECIPHSTLSGYFLTKVDIGKKKLVNVISSCSDCCVNLRVVVSMKNKFSKKDSKEETSIEKKNCFFNGNFCSFKDLGIIYNTEESSKIIQLPIDAPVGCSIQNYLHLNDNIIDISVHPNRMDCLSILGISREIAAFNKVKLHLPEIRSMEPTITDQIFFQIQSEKDCLNYFARIIKNININTQTPIWIKERLRRCGIYSKNILIDISNYILLEFGQPIYIFDLRKVCGNITIRRSNPNEIFYLSGKKIVLENNILVIADTEKVLAIAGVIDESIYLNSFGNNILLVCIFFNPSMIIGNARRYSAITNFSRIYEHGVDYNMQKKVIEYITSMFVNLCNNVKFGPISHVVSKFLVPKVINFHQKNLHRLIGNFIPEKEIKKILNYLGFKILHTRNSWKIITPSWRFDVFLEEDIMEEIIRIYGYEKIPKIPMCSYSYIDENYSKKFSLLPTTLSKIRDILVNRGYQEIITYSFVDPTIQKLLCPSRSAKKIINPISKEMSVMRLSLWTGLIKSFVYNQNRQRKRIRLFESGLCFELEKKSKIEQNFLFSGLVSGLRFNEHWDLINKEVDFYDLKGDLESVFYMMDIFHDIKFKNSFYSSLHPGQSADIFLRDIKIGHLGAIHPRLRKKLGIKNPIFLFEIFLKHLFISEKRTKKISDISCFPSNKRDLTFVMKNDVSISEILSECQNISMMICSTTTTTIKIILIDIYQEKIERFKSFSIRLFIQDTSKTLKEKEISNIIENFINQLTGKFPISLRS